MELKPLERFQFAHVDGHTSVCFNTDGTHILTCGSDGDVRVFKGIDDGDPISVCVGEMVLALAYNGEHFYVGSENHYVQAYSFPDAKRDGIVSRFTAPVTHIDVSADGRYIAAGSCDMEVHVADTFASNSVTKLIGHTAPITGVAVDPKSSYVATSSCDGSVRVWDIESGHTVKTLPNLLPTCNDFFRAVVLGRPSWQGGSCTYLAVPTEKKISLYDRDTWLPVVTLSHPKINGKFSLAEFSPCGTYLSAATTSGELVVWHVQKEKAVAAYVHPKGAALSCIAWHPDSTVIAVCDRLGQLTLLEDWQPVEIEEEVNPVYDNDNENEISIEEIKRSVGFGTQQLQDSDDARSVSSLRSYDANKPPINVHLQSAFQPSSTPTHFARRFMVWNSVGMVRGFNTEEEKSIDVEFHDPTFHHTLFINNYDDFEMASLSKRGLVLASNSSEDDSTSKLKCILLNAWDGSKEWVLPLPKDETITAIVAADKWVSAATSLNHVRVFSFAGSQRQPLAAPGPVVCMAGHDRKCAVVYHQGIGAPQCQNLGVIVYEMNELYVRTVAPAQPLPLSPNTTLMWAGFSDEGRLCAYDSVGVMRCLAADAKHWMVLADTRLQPKGPSDQYFMIGVSERDQNMRCVLVKGGHYPPTTPRPIMVQIPFKLPLCDPDNEKTTLEDTFWRLLGSLPNLDEMGQNSEDYASEVDVLEKKMFRTVLALFANACKANLDMRAADVASLMPEHMLQKAATYASKSGKMHLADKLSNITPVDWRDEARNAVGTVSHVVHTTEHDNPYVGDHCSQRDLFEDTQQNYKTPAEPRILNQMNDEDSPKIIMTPNPRQKNPFKVFDKAPTGPRGLAFFDQPPKAKVTVEPAKSSFNTKKVSRNAVNKSNENKQPPKPTFISWFSENKESLSKEHPDMSDSELTKKGMIIFRQTLNRNNIDSQGTELRSNDTETPNSESQKRKLEDSEGTLDTVKRIANDKLSAFAFKNKNQT